MVIGGDMNREWVLLVLVKIPNCLVDGLEVLG